jgi:polysaccharide chain length determinant protein (PEP-CTERM system associated)
MMETQQTDFSKYLQLVYKKRYLFIVVAVTIVSTAMAAAFLLPEVYEAESTVFIERNVIETLVKDIAITPSMDDRFSVLAYAIKSRNILLKVLDDLDVVVGGDDSEAEQYVKKFQKWTTVKTDTRGRTGMSLFVISYRDRDAVFARDYVNALVRRYIEENLSEKREEAYGANRFLSEQIRYFKDRLDSAEEKVVNFRKDRGIYIAVDEAQVVKEMKDHQERIDELKIQRMELEAKQELIRRQLEREQPYTVTLLGRRTDDPRARVLFLQNRLNELLTQYTENYPEVIRIRAEIESMKYMLRQEEHDESPSATSPETEMSMPNPLYEQMKEQLAMTEVELAGLEAREEHLRRRIAEKQEYLQGIPSEKKKLMDMTREMDTYKGIYGELVARLGQSEVSKQMEIQDKAATFRVVDPAILPVQPISPDKVKIILLGLVFSIAGGAGIVIGLDQMDKSVKTVDGLRALGLPVLGVIPSIKNEDELQKVRKRDALIYSSIGVYVLCILLVLVKEKLGISLHDITQTLWNMI